MPSEQKDISTDKSNLTQLLEILYTASECSGSKKTGGKTFLEEDFMKRVTFLPGIKGGVSFSRPGCGECGLQKKQVRVLRHPGESLDQDSCKGVSGKGCWEGKGVD